jgi:CRISPR/Cas system-associated exonuclease Cas4 (RecB family)
MLKHINEILNLDLLFANLDNEHNKRVSHRDIDGKFHPSALGDCERKLFFAFKKTEPRHNIPPALRSTFDHGTAVHSWIQDKLVKSLRPIADKVSVECEVSINATQWAIDHNLAGSADALITIIDGGGKVRDNTKIVYELKTSGSTTWNSLRSPLPKHLIQANCYAACLDAEYVLIDYFNKDKDTHKRFLLEADTQIQHDISTTLFAVMFSENVDTLQGADSWTCRNCSYAYTCDVAERND